MEPGMAWNFTSLGLFSVLYHSFRMMAYIKGGQDFVRLANLLL